MNGENAQPGSMNPEEARERFEHLMAADRWRWTGMLMMGMLTGLAYETGLRGIALSSHLQTGSTARRASRIANHHQ